MVYYAEAGRLGRIDRACAAQSRISPGEQAVRIAALTSENGTTRFIVRSSFYARNKLYPKVLPEHNVSMCRNFAHESLDLMRDKALRFQISVNGDPNFYTAVTQPSNEHVRVNYQSEAQ
jgi:hypothetical protein